MLQVHQLLRELVVVYKNSKDLLLPPSSRRANISRKYWKNPMVLELYSSFMVVLSSITCSRVFDERWRRVERAGHLGLAFATLLGFPG